ELPEGSLSFSRGSRPSRGVLDLPERSLSFSKDPQSSRGVPEPSEGSPNLLKGSPNFPRGPRGSQRVSKLPEGSLSFSKGSRTSREGSELLQGSQKLPRVLQTSQGLPAGTGTASPGRCPRRDPVKKGKAAPGRQRRARRAEPSRDIFSPGVFVDKAPN
uniref:Uncharacterized protein n=1 Tax=Catharus ustulatus TaxID=91951 RepID=A0A8C3V102_CATUS